MSQVSKRQIKPEIQQKITDIFLTTLIHMRDKATAADLLKDLLTPTEKIMLSKRLSIAYMLEKGSDYHTIKQTLKVSGSTISRISVINATASKGFKKIIRKMIKDDKIKLFFISLEHGIDLTFLPPKGVDWHNWRKQIENNYKKKSVQL